MTDGKFFQRGKVQELHSELLSEKNEGKRRKILKRIIANMSMGTDMAPLVPDVLACASQTANLQTKKLVCLFVVNYPKSRQDFKEENLAAFTRGLVDPNPLIRALTIRTLTYICDDHIMATVIQPLKQCLSDKDPYVRKTAAVGALKVFLHDRALFEQHDLLQSLISLLSDASPLVLANSVSCLSEISERSEQFQLTLNNNAAKHLIDALTDVSEWGQTYILEALVYYVPQDKGDAEKLIEKITPRLQHTNSAVVLAASKAILYLLNYSSEEKLVEVAFKKIVPPLLSLLAGGYEVQYVTLRNILLLIQRYPVMLDQLKMFFCKYDDPVYIKSTKLQILHQLTNESNATQVLAELKEYASEVDVDFARRAVRSIGVLALRVDTIASNCVTILMELISSRVSYAVQEAIVVMRDILRRYPGRYDSNVGSLCDCMDSLTEPEAKAALIWIVGEYSDRIDDPHFIFEALLEGYPDEAKEVKLALLTAIVKLFLKKPSISQDLLWRNLKYVMELTDDPDLRDRGYIYWRLLSANPDAARAIIMSEKPVIRADNIDLIDPPLLNELMLHIGSLASVYYQSPTSFIANAKVRQLQQSSCLVPSALTWTRKAPTNILVGYEKNPYAQSTLLSPSNDVEFDLMEFKDDQDELFT